MNNMYRAEGELIIESNEMVQKLAKQFGVQGTMFIKFDEPKPTLWGRIKTYVKKLFGKTAPAPKTPMTIAGKVLDVIKEDGKNKYVVVLGPQ